MAAIALPGLEVGVQAELVGLYFDVVRNVLEWACSYDVVPSECSRG